MFVKIAQVEKHHLQVVFQTLLVLSVMMVHMQLQEILLVLHALLEDLEQVQQINVVELVLLVPIHYKDQLLALIVPQVLMVQQLV